jgi:hypothetical protein
MEGLLWKTDFALRELGVKYKRFKKKVTAQKHAQLAQIASNIKGTLTARSIYAARD